MTGATRWVALQWVGFCLPPLLKRRQWGKAAASVPTIIPILCADPDPVTGDMESAMAVQLNPWVEYEFRVVASNAIGTGDPSAPSRAIRTKEAGNYYTPSWKPRHNVPTG